MINRALIVVFSGKFWEIFQNIYLAERVINFSSKHFEKIGWIGRLYQCVYGHIVTDQFFLSFCKSRILYKLSKNNVLFDEIFKYFFWFFYKMFTPPVNNTNNRPTTTSPNIQENNSSPVTAVSRPGELSFCFFKEIYLIWWIIFWFNGKCTSAYLRVNNVHYWGNAADTSI